MRQFLQANFPSFVQQGLPRAQLAQTDACLAIFCCRVGDVEPGEVFVFSWKRDFVGDQAAKFKRFHGLLGVFRKV